MVAPVNELRVREENTRRVNAQLRLLRVAEFKRTFPSWKSEPRAYEFLDIVKVDRDTNPRFVYITFSCYTPLGEEGEYTLMYNANSLECNGVVIIARINNRYALIRQDRPAAEERMTELPRSFPSPLDIQPGVVPPLLSMNGMALRCGLDELGEPFMETGRIKSKEWVGRFKENTGHSRVSPDVWYFNIKVDRTLLANRRTKPNEHGLELKLYTLRELIDAFLDDQFDDAHTATALIMFFNQANLWPAVADPEIADEQDLRWKRYHG